MKSQVRWTPEEVELLKTHGSNLLLHELHDLLPSHTPLGISVKRKRLGVILSDDYLNRQGEYGRSFVDEDNLCKTDQHLTLDDLDNTTTQILVGSILGDGSIKRNGSGGKNRDKWKMRNFIFYDHHKSPQFDYTDWKKDNLQTFLAKSSRSDEKNRSEMWTVSHPIFTQFRDKFYPSRTKCNKSFIPDDMISRLDLLGLMVWYLDDGYLGVPKHGKDSKGRHRRPCPTIAAKGWDYSHLVKATVVLNENLGLHLRVRRNRHRDGYNNLVVIPSKDRDVVFPQWQELAEEYNIPSCMQYKLSLNLHPDKVAKFS